MKRAIGRAAWLLSCSAVLGLVEACAPSPPLPVRAASAEVSECRDAVPPDEEVRALESMKVLRVRPYAHQDACNGACTVWGVDLIVQPQGAADPERFARLLRCHNLRVLSGEEDPARIPNDPYGLVDSWLEIHVEVKSGYYVVRLVGDHVADTLRILRLARAYAAAQRAVAL